MIDMSSLQNLLNRGNVVWKPLGKIVTIKNGKGWEQLKAGNIPVYGSGGIMGHVDTYTYDKPTVLIPSFGSIQNLFYVDKPFWNVGTIYYTEIDTNQIIPKFLYYYLKAIDLKRFNTGTTVPSLTRKNLNRIKIPVLPLEDQERIVTFLDKLNQRIDIFNNLIPYEIELSTKQYKYYKDKLFHCARTI